jgi:hypothetical protein
MTWAKMMTSSMGVLKGVVTLIGMIQWKPVNPSAVKLASLVPAWMKKKGTNRC